MPVKGVDRPAGDARRFEIDLVGQVLHIVIGLCDAGAAESIGLDNVGARFEIGAVDLFDDLRLGEGEQVIITLDILAPSGKAVAAVARLIEGVALYHGAHGPIDDENAILE